MAAVDRIVSSWSRAVRTIRYEKVLPYRSVLRDAVAETADAEDIFVHGVETLSALTGIKGDYGVTQSRPSNVEVSDVATRCAAMVMRSEVIDALLKHWSAVMMELQTVALVAEERAGVVKGLVGTSSRIADFLTNVVAVDDSLCTERFVVVLMLPISRLRERLELAEASVDETMLELATLATRVLSCLWNILNHSLGVKVTGELRVPATVANLSHLLQKVLEKQTIAEAAQARHGRSDDRSDGASEASGRQHEPLTRLAALAAKVSAKLDAVVVNPRFTYQRN
jgi:hypothetical protein